MMSSPRTTLHVIGGDASSAGDFNNNRVASQELDRYRFPARGSSEPKATNRADGDLVVSFKKPPRILLVDAVLALNESHLVLLRLIPAIVETLACCSDMFLHEEHAYALVILVLHPQGREIAEVAHFVRRRWSAARILLLQSESAVIDDWLYDDRVDPHPVTVRDAAIRLMTEEKLWIPA